MNEPLTTEQFAKQFPDIDVTRCTVAKWMNDHDEVTRQWEYKDGMWYDTTDDALVEQTRIKDMKSAAAEIRRLTKELEELTEEVD